MANQTMKTTSRLIPLLGLASSLAFASDIPPGGKLDSEGSPRSLAYSCMQQGEREMKCFFNQTILRRGVEPEKAAEAKNNFQDQIRQFREALFAKPVPTEMKDLCSVALATTDGDESRMAPEARAQYRNSNTEGKAFLRGALEPIAALCRAKDLKSFDAAAPGAIERGMKFMGGTCTVGSRNFNETFVRQGGSSTWVIKDEPSAECGVVRMHRFERTFEWGREQWNYVERQVVTNPSGRLAGQSCKAQEKPEVTYRSRFKQRVFGCAAVEFTVE